MDERKHPLQYSIRELESVCYGSMTGRHKESYVGLFCRWFSIRLTKFLLMTPVTPNWITVISVLLYFIGLGFFYDSHVAINLVGCFFVFLSIVFDGCDGNVARFRNMTGVIGGRYVEPVSHDIQYGFGFLFVGVLLYVFGGSVVLIILGALAGIFKLLTRMLRGYFWVIQHQSFSQGDRVHSDGEFMRLSLIRRFLPWVEGNFFSSTSVLLVFFVGSLLGHIDWVLWYYAFGFGGLWLALFVKQIVMIRSGRL